MATGCMLLPAPNTSCCWYINAANGYTLLPAPNTSCCSYINRLMATCYYPHQTHRAVGTLIRPLAAGYYPSQTLYAPRTCFFCQANIIDIVTRPRAGRTRKRGSISCLGKRFCLLPNVQTGSRSRLVSYSNCNGRSFPGVKEARSSR